ncbi:MAG: replication initiator protein [Microvirus sp.]|nr:MAG: replication initiator protein [Microvirus sp.]
MPCYFPIQGWKARSLNGNGKRPIVFDQKHGYIDMPVSIACGQCTGCRLERSRQWALRCMHEAKFHTEKMYVTLTYNDQHLPLGGTLIKNHFQNFMKRLRQEFNPRYKKDFIGPRQKKNIRYFQCGEYGEQLGRPHYHAIIFGVDMPDKKAYKKNAQGHTLFKSALLESLWTHGDCYIGAVTMQSAAYVARYIMKKVGGELAPDHYRHVDTETGEVTARLPEYITMSLKPAIGKTYYEKFAADVFPSDFVIENGRKHKPPNYYLKQLEKTDPAGSDAVKRRRVGRMARSKLDQTAERLAVRHEVKLARISKLKRDIH